MQLVILFVLICLRLSGTAPYKGGDFDKDLEDIMRHRLSFELPVWKDVSAAAKDFITNMLKINPAHRLTVDQALQHPWITRVGRRVSRPANIDTSAESSAQLLSTSPDLYPNVRDGLDAHRTQKMSSKLGLNRESTFSDDEDFDSRGPSASSSPSNETGDISDAFKSVKLLPK
jgi:serine/threonine protein kinase